MKGDLFNMLMINDEKTIQEVGEIFQRFEIIRGERRMCIQITIPEQDGVAYDTLNELFVDGISIKRRITTTKVVSVDVTPEGAEEPVYEDREVTENNDYDLSPYKVAGDIIDKRDGSFVVLMGVETETEILEEQNAELMLTLVGGEE